MRPAIGFFALAILAGPLSAQRNPAQNNIHIARPRPADDSTLTGMKSVYLTAGGNSLDSSTFQDFALELRKAGIRIVSADQPADAQMFLVVSKLRCGLGGCDGQYTIEIDQRSQVLRLGRAQMATTWLSETLGLGVQWDEWVKATAKQETDDFLNRWLTANGR
jgi:hypothetical protein